MPSLILTTKSKESLRIFKELAKKLKISFKIINEEDLEEKALLKAIKEGLKGEYVDEEKFIRKLKK